MPKHLPLLLTVALCSAAPACAGAAPREYDPGDLPARFRKLLPLHAKLAAPKPGDWLDRHHEPGQTYREYVAGEPVRADPKRRTIYIQPLGEFRGAQRKIVNLTAEYMQIYFGLPVKVQKDLPLSVVPDSARRVHPTWGDKQVLTRYVLDKVLRPRLPEDAVAMIAFTASDLWPGEGWNFVFGEASLEHRVGVWSIYRNGDADENEASFRLCLRRTVKTATHETGHMFSMYHCVYYECNMCGSNHRAESDRHPLWLCPVCLAKLVHATGVDPAKRYERLAAWCKENGLEAEGEFFEKSLGALRGE